MEFLPNTSIDFDGLADQVSSDFFNQGTTLNSGVIKVAQQRQFNPEQVKRLVEKTNTQATVKMLKSTLDKKAELNLADYSEVIQVTHPVTPQEKTASEVVAPKEVLWQLPNTRKDKYTLRDLPIPAIEKRASETNKSKEICATLFKLEKEAEELKLKKMALELGIQDNLDFIVSEFSKWGAPEFSKVADESLTIYGNDVLPILNKVAAYLEEPSEFNKVAYVIDDNQPILEKVGMSLKGIKDLISINNDINSLSEKIACTQKEAKELMVN